MATTIPTIPSMPAGYVAQAADLNNLAYAAQFLLQRPMTRVHDTAGTLAIGTTATTIVFGAADYDTDGMWNAGSPSRLTIQTPGFYKATYFISLFTSGTTIPTCSYVSITTGTNNPAGAGVNNTCWGGYGAGNVGGNRVGPHSSGVIPWFMYPNDFVQLIAVASSAGMTTNVSGFSSTYLALELVSI